MKKITIAFVALIFPSFMVSFLLRLLGCKIGKNFKIGFSFMYLNKLNIGDNVVIGNFNLILNEAILMSDSSKIGYLNILKGPFTLNLDKQAAIGNQNYFTRGIIGITYGNAELKLGNLTKITSKHHIDLTRSISLGKYSILAGIKSQIWTHGYVHNDEGPGRFRVDGTITIGDNVYVGSGCIFNPGISVSNAISIGSGSVISKNLIEKGMYVSQGLRYLNHDPVKTQNRLAPVDYPNLIEKVYTKDS